MNPHIYFNWPLFTKLDIKTSGIKLLKSNVQHSSGIQPVYIVKEGLQFYFFRLIRCKQILVIEV